MKFNFPKKQSKIGVTVMVLPAIVEKIRLIAEHNQSTIIGVYETLLTEAVEEYEDKNGKFSTGEELIKKSEDVNYDNKFIIHKKEKKAAKSFCQNSNCSNIQKSFNKDEMIEVNNFLVCSEECADEIKGDQLPELN